MPTEMRFMPMLKQFLLKRGEVYTVRKYKMEERDVEVEDVGTCRRIPISVISDSCQLETYVPLSGFPTLQAWWEKIEQFIPWKDDPMYLYHVVLRK